MSLGRVGTHLMAGREILGGDRRRRDAGAWLAIERAWSTLQDAEKRGADRELVAEWWHEVARFIVCEWAPVAMTIAKGLIDDEERKGTYEMIETTLRSVFRTRERFEKHGFFKNETSITSVAEDCKTFLAELRTFETAALA